MSVKAFFFPSSFFLFFLYFSSLVSKHTGVCSEDSPNIILSVHLKFFFISQAYHHIILPKTPSTRDFRQLLKFDEPILCCLLNHIEKSCVMPPLILHSTPSLTVFQYFYGKILGWAIAPLKLQVAPWKEAALNRPEQGRQDCATLLLRNIQHHHFTLKSNRTKGYLFCCRMTHCVLS